MARLLLVAVLALLPRRVVLQYVVVKNGLLALEQLSCKGLRIINKFNSSIKSQGTVAEISAVTALRDAMQTYCDARVPEKP